MSGIKRDILYYEIKERILSRQYEPGMRLPKEILFAEELGVARGTLRPVLMELESEGLLRRLKGKGTFVSGQDRHVYLIVGEDITSVRSALIHIARGVENKIRESGHSACFCGTHDLRRLTMEEAEERFRGMNIRGVFLIESNFSGMEPEAALFRNLSLPVVLPWAQRWDHETLSTFAFCHPDWSAAFAAGLRFLAGQGHRRVAVISDRTEYPRGFLEIPFEDYRPLYQSIGLEYRDEYITHVSPTKIKMTPYNIEKVVTNLLQSAAPPTALACASDLHSDAVYAAVKNLNLKIPDDISVLGYCGFPGYVFMSPPLTTVDLELENIGRDAASLMLRSGEWFDPGRRPPVIYSNYKILKRGSVAPPRKGR